MPWTMCLIMPTVCLLADGNPKMIDIGHIKELAKKMMCHLKAV